MKILLLVTIALAILLAGMRLGCWYCQAIGGDN
jgi:hypothetical protein